MYIILDSKLQRIGTLSNHSTAGTPFYNDQITQQIADDDQELSLQSLPDNATTYDPNGNSKDWGHTLDQIFVPYGYPDTDKIAEGNSLAYQDPNNGHWYIMRLTSVMDSTDGAGNHYKQATGVNLCIWTLGKTVHWAQTLQHVNSTQAFRALLNGTGWYLNPNSELVGGSSDITFDGTSSSQSMLQQLCQTYGAEIDAYVLFPQAFKMNDGHYYSSNFQIALKRIDVERHLGVDTGDRIVYGRNATNIQRTMVDDNLYTRLYVYGQGGSTCACDITDNKPYVEDKVANEIYNPSVSDNAETFLEGAVTSQTMKDPTRLAEWGIRQLKMFNHPRANYTIGVSSALNDAPGNEMVTNANLGDTFRVIDYKMDPVLTAEARVIKKQLSFANPAQNNITLGEYTTVNVVPPAFIRNLQQGESNHVNEILDEIRRNPHALTCTIDKPDGTTWHAKEAQKKFIAHVYVLDEDITGLIQPQGYIWQLWQNGQINNDFVDKHSRDGQTLTLNNDIKFQSDSADNNNDDSNNNDNSNSDDYIPNNDNIEDTFDINGALSGPNEVTGEVRLLIDTDYISNQEDVNFNTNNIKHIFTVGKWTDNWGDDRVGALQYINYNPNDQDYYCSLVYYGRERPRKKDGHWYYGDKDYNVHNAGLVDSKSHSEIARLDSNGNYIDSMILIFSEHNSNFGLDYTSYKSTPYIWTTMQDYFSPSDRFWLVRIPYSPGQVIKLSDIPNDQKIMMYGEKWCMAYYDNSSDTVVFNHDDTTVNPGHEVDFYNGKDLLQNHNNTKPFKKIELTDYGFSPKMEDYDLSNGNGDTHNPEDDSTQQTFQSNCLYYPYYFFASGNMNMSDPRMIYCINISSGTKIFSKDLDMDTFNLSNPNKIIGNNPGNYVFAEPEAFNWTKDDHGNLVFLYGLNVGYQNLKTHDVDYDNQGLPEPDYKHYEQLYQIGFDLNNNKTDNNQSDHSNNGTPVIKD